MNANVKQEWRRAKRAGVFLLGFSCVLSFFANILMLTIPLFMLLIYDRVLASRSEQTLVSLLIIAVVLVVLMGLIDYARRRITARFGAQFQERLERSVTEAAYAKGARNTRARSDTINTGELDRIRGFLHSGSLVAVFDVLWTPIFLGVVFVFHSLLGWMAVVGLMVLALIFMMKGWFVKSRQAEADAVAGKVGTLTTTLNLSEELMKTQRMFPAAQDRWHETRNERRDTAIALHDRIGWFDMMARQLLMLMRAFMLAAGTYLVLKGQLTVGAMVASVLLLSRVFYPVERFLRELPRIRTARESWEKLRKAILSTPTAKDPPLDMPEEDGPRVLRLEGLLVKGPGERGAIIKGISLEIVPGEITQVIGLSGTGKSVLSRTMIGGFPFQGGRITYGGRTLSHFSEEELSRIFGYVPERNMFFAGNVADNIACMDPDINNAAVMAATKKAQVHDTIQMLASGYDTLLDLWGRPFCAGEARQVALARALYRTPHILVIDEPAGMFDQGAQAKALTRTIEEYTGEGGSVVVFGRQKSLLGLKSRVFRLSEGKLKPDDPDKKLKPVANKPKSSGDKKSGDVKWIGDTAPKVVGK